MLRRVVKSTGTQLFTSPFGLMDSTYTGSGVQQLENDYYMLAGRLIGERESGVTVFLLTDELGSVHISLSAAAGSAAVTSTQLYSPYGSPRYRRGTITTEKSFTGQYHDVSGLDSYHARYYDPVVGRFVSADTAQGNGQGMDPYSYVGNNPETLNDPTGRMVACPHCGDPGVPPSSPNRPGGSDNGDGGGYCNLSGCDDGEGTRVSGPPSNSPTGHPNPKARFRGTGGCDSNCGKRDKILILHKINDEQQANEMLLATTVADGLALASDIIAGLIDWAAQDIRGAVFEGISAVARLVALIGDIFQLNPDWKVPAIVIDLMQAFKVVANIADLVEGVIGLFDPVKAVADKAANWATQIAKPAVQAAILQLFASAASGTGPTIWRTYRNVSYYDDLRATIGSYTDAQAHDACINQY